MILNRPITRARVVCVRYIAAVFYTFVMMGFIAGSALAIGVLKQGTGGMFAWNLASNLFAFYDFVPALQRYLISLPLLGLSFVTITSIGFMFSCCNMKPAAASILCLSVTFIDWILHNIPQFEDIKYYFLSTHMETWTNIFQPKIPVVKMVEDYAYLIGADLTFLIIGIMIFQGRDFKS
jgi:ABC-2 type transport system permease protein